MNRIKITEERGEALGDFYGIFFEDINHAADGGLYAETIRNRSFEFSPTDNPAYNGLTAWKEYEPEGTRVSLSIKSRESACGSNPHYLVMEVKTDGAAAGVKNEGYNSGIPVYGSREYRLKIRAKSAAGERITVSIVGASGEIYDSSVFTLTGEWAEYSSVLRGARDDFSARLFISLNMNGKVMLDFVSLMPCDTYKNRENGLRRDIAVMLEELKPRFVRFPGGCLVHDGSLNADDRDSCYRWKNTIGRVEDRPARRSNWKYNQTLGLGYYEYFCFCEDIGAEPLPVLPAGYNPHSRQAVPLDEMQEWVDDAFDLIEFANGGADTVWGSLRADLGHPEPFNLKYLGIGNEEVGSGFFERYDIIHKAVRERYPAIKLINSAGPFNQGGEYERGWASARKNGSDIIDEHYYMTPEWFLANYHRYDNFNEKTKVFLGEYASWGNTYYNALAEAAYMTGLENNARAVALVCYAPLLCNEQYVNWEPNMIWFDNHRVYGSANYYVQKMFMNNLPTYLLKTEKSGFDKTYYEGEEFITGETALAADQCRAEFSDITVTDNETGISQIFDARTINSGETDLCSIRSGHYTIEFTAKRLSGELGFKLIFGRKDAEHYSVWSIGGWQNQDTLIDKFEGHGSCLTQSRFSVETGVEYRLKLVVDGRMLMTYINGVPANKTEDKRCVTEELYTTAGIDEAAGEFIVKAVNVRNEPVCGTLEFPCEVQGTVSELSGYSREDKNSFDEPERVYPKESCIKSSGRCIEYEFRPMSVNVFRVGKA